MKQDFDVSRNRLRAWKSRIPPGAAGIEGPKRFESHQSRPSQNRAGL